MIDSKLLKEREKRPVLDDILNQGYERLTFFEVDNPDYDTIIYGKDNLRILYCVLNDEVVTKYDGTQ